MFPKYQLKAVMWESFKSIFEDNILFKSINELHNILRNIVSKTKLYIESVAIDRTHSYLNMLAMLGTKKECSEL